MLRIKLQALLVSIYLLNAVSSETDQGGLNQAFQKLCDIGVPGFCELLDKLQDKQDDRSVPPEVEPLAEEITTGAPSGEFQTQSPISYQNNQSQQVPESQSVQQSSPDVYPKQKTQQYGVNSFDNAYNDNTNEYNNGQQQCGNKNDVCYQPLSKGICRLGLWRYSYDPSQHQCIGFVFGGCLGNKNNFQTYDDCWNCCIQ